MAELLINNVVTTLAAAITSSDTTMTVASGVGTKLPSGGNFRAILATGEIVLCTARSVDTLTIDRGQEGTTAAAAISGSTVAFGLTVGALTAWFATQAAALSNVPNGLAGLDGLGNLVGTVLIYCDTQANLFFRTTPLALGQFAYSSDGLALSIGDGVTGWADLPRILTGLGGSDRPVGTLNDPAGLSSSLVGGLWTCSMTPGPSTAGLVLDDSADAAGTSLKIWGEASNGLTASSGSFGFAMTASSAAAWVFDDPIHVDVISPKTLTTSNFLQQIKTRALCFFATTLATSGTVTPNLSSSVFKIGTISGNLTVAAPLYSTATPQPVPLDGQRITFQGSTSSTGTETVTWNSAYRFGTQLGVSFTSQLSSLFSASNPNIKFRISFTYDTVLAAWVADNLVYGY